MTEFGYRRVSTAEQVESGLGLDAQEAAISAAASLRGWTIEWVTDSGVSGSVDPKARAALGPVLSRIGRGDVLIVAKLDRLSRSLSDFAHLMDRSTREGWSIVCLDLGVDTTTPSGELMANVMATFAQYERRIIGQRTREGLAERKRQGARLGRPVAMPPEIRERIAMLRAGGSTLAGIANTLTTEGVPTARGGSRWYHSTIRAVLASIDLDTTANAARPNQIPRSNPNPGKESP